MVGHDISKEKMDQIIELATKKKPWTVIELETGVPRRKAKSAYQQFELEQLREEVKKARVTIATEETRGHINNLVLLAEYIADNLEIPPIAFLEQTSSGFINGLLHRQIFHEPSEISGIQVSGYPKGESVTETKKLKRIYRQNKLLFEALKIHTTQHGRWRSFDQWIQSWDTCRNCVQNIRIATHQLFEKFLKLEGQDLQSRMKSLTTVDKIVHGITEAIWEHTINHGLTEGSPSFTINRLLQSEDTGLEFNINRICNNTINNLYKTEPVQYIHSLDTAIRTMKKSITQIEENFDGIKLRPLLLNSRCQLCP